MKYLLLLFILFVNLKCAQPTRKNVLIVQPEFQEYVNSFVDEAKERGLKIKITNLIIRMVPRFKDEETLAQCRLNLIPKISVSKEFWDWASFSAKEQVLYHELGHCILNLNHTDDSIVYKNEYIPKSIMSSTLFADYFYDEYRQYYVDELFWEYMK